jgi:hypothetical protein
VTTAARQRWPRRTARWLGRALLFLIGLYLVGRAAVEVVSLDPAKPETYRHDWGGPHYSGVMLVHVGPGALAMLALAAYFKRRSTRSAGGDSYSMARRESDGR